MPSRKPLNSPLNESRRSLLKQAALAAGGAAAIGIGPSAFAAKAKPKSSATPVVAAADPTDITKKKIDDIVKGYDKLTGVFTLYRQDDDLYMELTPQQMDSPFFLEATRETGTAGIGGVAGDPLADILFQFHFNPDTAQIELIEPNINYRATQGTPEALSLKRSFAQSYLASYPIAAYRPDPKQEAAINAITDKHARLLALQKAATGYLISIPTFFTSDIPGFVQGMPGYSIDAAQTYMKSVKDFSQNMVVRTSYSFNGQAAGMSFMGITIPADTSELADPRGFIEEVDYNLYPLPTNDYRPRSYDDRIGYFTQDYETFNDDVSQDNIRRMILRWNLVKKDPTAAVSDPVQPIVFWVDNATPLQYRNAVREGVLSWIPAFEKIGFSNAVQCQIMPDDADWDPADMTHNVVRWTSSFDAGYAVAQFRHNPLTGEMLNAAITIDASMARFTNLSYPTTVLTGEPAPDSETFGAASSSKLSAPQIAAMYVSANTSSYPSNRCECNYGPGVTKAASFGWDSFMLEEAGADTSGAPPTLEEFTHHYLRSVVSHESGHCLGLRHNFKGSTLLSEEQRQDPAMTSLHGVTASVMDYLPANVPPLGGKWADVWTPCTGPYDHWAIAYGYSDFGSDPIIEKQKLAALASQSQAFGHTFASDEDADSVDPMIMRFDMGAEPIQYRVAMLERARYMLNNLEFKYPVAGAPYYDLTRLFTRTLNQYADQTLEVARFVGGIVTNRNHLGDPGYVLPVQPVPYDDQRVALHTICNHLLSDQALTFSPGLLAKLEENPSPMSDDMPSDFTTMQNISVLDFVTSMQNVGLYTLLNHDTLSRMETNEYRTGASGDPLRVLDVIEAVTGSVWPELDGKPHVISLQRRRLQRTYITAMFSLVRPDSSAAIFGPVSNDDSYAFALLTLRRLSPQLEKAENISTDSSTKAHLAEIRLQINQFLHAQMVV